MGGGPGAPPLAPRMTLRDYYPMANWPLRLLGVGLFGGPASAAHAKPGPLGARGSAGYRLSGRPPRCRRRCGGLGGGGTSTEYVPAPGALPGARTDAPAPGIEPGALRQGRRLRSAQLCRRGGKRGRTVRAGGGEPVWPPRRPAVMGCSRGPARGTGPRPRGGRPMWERAAAGSSLAAPIGVELVRRPLTTRGHDGQRGHAEHDQEEENAAHRSTGSSNMSARSCSARWSR